LEGVDVQKTFVLAERIVIIGNSGSGKSHLARELAAKLCSKLIHLDQLFWEPGGFNVKRPRDTVLQEVQALSLGNRWIMDGVFGDLAAVGLQNATVLIFLNKTWAECKSALLARGSESSKQICQVEAEKHFAELLSWAEAYTIRENSRSLKGHSQLFEEFKGTKFEIRSRKETAAFLANFG
jgi:adenylate kinase family enzyme